MLTRHSISLPYRQAALRISCLIIVIVIMIITCRFFLSQNARVIKGGLVNVLLLFW